MTAALLEQLRKTNVADRVGARSHPYNGVLLEEWEQSGVKFVSSSEQLTGRYYQAVRELLDCIKPTGGDELILNEGGIYYGCWLESTGTINAEILSRFLPSVTTATYSAFAKHQREDGLLPYKIGADGPAFAQIQIVTPLARSVYDHYRLNGLDASWLEIMADAMARNDEWLARHRDTLGTGGVEAFSTYDTGHDLSSRFWHVPDSPFLNDPARYDPDNPILPFVAPDLTANVACQRHYLGLIEEALGRDGGEWESASKASRAALFAQCFDEEDEFFYDRDRHGRQVRLQSDVLLRVLACEIGDRDFFRSALRRYLLNTRKFFAKFPLTSIALDDPRFDPNFAQNSWAGPSNFLSLIRAPRAFEHHGHHTELTWILLPVLAALFAADRFPQTLNPFTGEAGFTEKYSPSILCLLDSIERLSGILPRPDGSVWVTSVLPKPVLHKHETWSTGYSRKLQSSVYELINTPEGGTIYRDGARIGQFPAGIRVNLGADGKLIGVTNVSARQRNSVMELEGIEYSINLQPNGHAVPVANRLVPVSSPELVLPSY